MNIDPQDLKEREKIYKEIVKKHSVFVPNDSNFFILKHGDDKNFDCLGLEEPRIAQYESHMLTKLNHISKYIRLEVPEEYLVDDIVVNIP
jgi:hypothetical protein